MCLYVCIVISCKLLLRILGIFWDAYSIDVGHHPPRKLYTYTSVSSFILRESRRMKLAMKEAERKKKKLIVLITVLFWEIVHCTYSFIKHFLMESWQTIGLVFGNGYCYEWCVYSLRNMTVISTSSVNFQNRKPNFAVEL